MLYNVEDFDVRAFINKIGIQKRKTGKQKRTSKNVVYRDIICAFDIETTLYKTGAHIGTAGKKIDDYISFMYVWQFQLGLDVTIIGRDWIDFVELMQEIVSVLGETRLCIFVHNLAYEFQFIRDKNILGHFIDEDSVFLVESRKPLKFTCFDGRIEFRCSYLHSNMSLDEFTDKMKVPHGKLSGEEFDYSKIRYPWTELTERELEYCTNDVQGLVECLCKECELDSDNLYTLPLTSTGYVRRDIKRALNKLPFGWLKKMLPNYETYKMLRRAFRGGNTHASRFYAGRRIDVQVFCNDFASSYPNVLLTRKYPITPFAELSKDCLNIDYILNLIKKGRAIVADVALYDVRLADDFFPVPYISRDKCETIVGAVYDNGRVLSADYLELTVTDVDLEILSEEYVFDIEIKDARFASYGYLPEEIKNVIREYFDIKTRLKGDKSQEIQYNKSKNKLNAIYGMSAQNPVKLETAYIDYDYIDGIHIKDGSSRYFLSLDEAERTEQDIYKIAHSENIEKSTMPYQWGVWCTAWARYNLEQAIKICGNDFLYCDTDSVYYFGEHSFEEFNLVAQELALKNGASALDSKGRRHYMGVMELDKTMIAFKTFGAKKYAYIDDNGLHITVAGVSKRKGADELSSYAKKHGLKDGLDAFEEDFVFDDAGGTESQYNDEPIEHFNLDGHDMYIPSNIAIKPSTYKVGLSNDYRTLLDFLIDNDLFELYRLNRAGAQLPSI